MEKRLKRITWTVTERDMIWAIQMAAGVVGNETLASEFSIMGDGTQLVWSPWEEIPSEDIILEISQAIYDKGIGFHYTESYGWSKK